MITRLEAIQDIRLGRGIQLTFEGHLNQAGTMTTFNVIIRRDVMRGGVEAAIDCKVMRRSYYIKLTPKQTLAYIRRHYPRSVPAWDEVRVQETIPNMPAAKVSQEMGAVA